MVTAVDEILMRIKTGAATAMTKKAFLEAEIRRWKASDYRKMQIAGEQYYRGEHDILSRVRTIIGEDGLVQEVENLPNNKIVDNQYMLRVDQKVNYLVGKPITIETAKEEYGKQLSAIFNKGFMRTLKDIGQSSLNCAIGWIYVYYGDKGELKLKQFKPWQILPFWKDEDHTELDSLLRVYPVEAYEGTRPVIIEKVEYYTLDGVERYILDNGILVDDVENPSSAYVEYGDKSFNWERIPVIPFKYNGEEVPLIARVKSLQDGINTMLSDFENNMQEDARNTILVIENYDGQGLGEFRRNLAQFGAVKVRTDAGGKGGLSTLTVEVNAENYKAIIQVFKKALIENAKGFDAKDDRLANNPNEMNIQSIYSDIDLDANGMETEYQASFEQLMWFVNTYLSNSGKGDFDEEEVTIVFNRDVLINTTELIDNLLKSVEFLSDETLVPKHPYAANDELKRIKKQRQQAEEEADEYKQAFLEKESEVDEE